MKSIYINDFLPMVTLKMLLISGFAILIFFLPAGFADATHEYCGNTDVPQSLVSTSGESSYGQSSYYAQSSYYRQSAYYSQATYYAQSAYITGVVINVEPPIVKKGEDVVISWNPGNTTACNLVGPNFTLTSPTNGTAANITGETTYTLTCTHFEHTYTQSVKVKVVPQIEET